MQKSGCARFSQNLIKPKIKEKSATNKGTAFFFGSGTWNVLEKRIWQKK